MNDVFCDSHGCFWVVCKVDHPEAEAFGPRGTSRQVTLWADTTPTFVARSLREANDGGFPILTEEGEDGWTRPKTGRVHGQYGRTRYDLMS